MSWPVLPLGLLGSQASTAAATTDNDTYQISRSLRFNSADSAYLSRTPSVAGNRKTWTWSGWVKRNKTSQNDVLFDASNNASTTMFVIRFTPANDIEISGYVSGYTYQINTTQLFRDPSAWYHVVVAFDTTQITASNRVKLYINGSQVTSFFGSPSYPTQDYAGGLINDTVQHRIGSAQFASQMSDAYLAEVNFIDGQALTPSSFGETDAITGRWKAKAYSGTTYKRYAATESMLSQSGLSSYTASFVVDNDITTVAFHSDLAGIGSFLQFDLGAGVTKNFRKIRIQGWKITAAGPKATWNVQYSDNGSSWTNVATGINMDTIGSNTYGSGTGYFNAGATWGDAGAHRYWRIYKTNAAAGGDYHTGVDFYEIDVAGNSYGTNGFYLPFSNNGGNTPYQLGADNSGNENDWTPNNFSVTPGVGNDSLTDSPSNYGTISTTLAPDTYQIGKSLRFNSADPAYLSRTPSVAGNRKTWTWSGWVKRGAFSATAYPILFSGGTTNSDTGWFGIWFNGDDTLRIGGASTDWLQTTQKFRDPSAWYHIVVAVDSTNVTPNNRIRFYVNGSEITSFLVRNNLAVNTDYGVNQAAAHRIGDQSTAAGVTPFDGYLAEVNFVDGQALTPSSFGTRDINTYLWKPKAYTGTYGTNGFYLPFSNNSSTQSLGWDQKGNITRYIAPGTYSYTVPTYSSSLVVEVWGGGGGGGQALLPGTDATNGGQSSFNGTVIANGGNRGVGASSGVGANGTGGTASGGDTNTTGNTGNSTAGVSSSTPSPNSGNSAIAGVVGPGGYNGVTGFPVGSGGGGAYWLGGSTPTAGAGGSGGYSKKTYAPGAISGTITVVVGAGGSAGIGNALSGGAGTDGMVRITVDGATTPSDWYQRNLSVDAGSGNDSLVDSPTYYGTLSTTPSEDTYQISKSLRFKGSTGGTMKRLVVASSNKRTWTWSGWVKRSTLGTVQQLFCRLDALSPAVDYTYLYFTPDNTIQYLDSGAGAYAGTSIATNYITSKAVFNDTSNWYHIVMAVDTTQVVETNRLRLYVNGTQITSFISQNYPNINNFTQINTSNVHYIGSNRQTSQFFEGYLADVNLIDGLALTPDNFGVRESGTYLWKPKAYTGTYGSNGFNLKFADISTVDALGTDSSGLGNTWTIQAGQSQVKFLISGTGTDSFVDSPTYYGTDNGAGGEARGSYCTLNPSDIDSNITLSNGNLDYLSSGTNVGAVATIGASTGKWYWEVTASATGTIGGSSIIGIVSGSPKVGRRPGLETGSYGYGASALKWISSVNTGYGSTWTNLDVIGVGMDLDAGTITFYKNGISQGQLASGLSGYYFPALGGQNTTGYTANFGQRPFAYAAPSGFRALRDYNKPPVQTGGEVRGNYCTLNPLDKYSSVSLSNGNLDASLTSQINGSGGVRGTIGASSGKWYWEVIAGTLPSARPYLTIGIDSTSLGNISSLNNVGSGGISSSYIYQANGIKQNNNTSSSYGASYTTNDVIGVALNLDSGTLEFYKNGSSQGVAYSGISGNFSPSFGLYTDAASSPMSMSFTANFGQRPWAFGAPFGFKPLRDYNKLPVPTGGEVRGNYCTLNPLGPKVGLEPTSSGYGIAGAKDGNLVAYAQAGGSALWISATQSMTTGKWYWEQTLNDATYAHDGVGIKEVEVQQNTTNYYWLQTIDGFFVFKNNGDKKTGSTSTSISSSLSAGNVIGVAFDADNSKLWFSVNGTWLGSGVPSSGTNPAFSNSNGITTSKSYVPVLACCGNQVAGNNVWACNFGQRPWAYDAPFGFKPLCTTLLSQPIIQKPSTAMDVVTYTGNGSTQTISGLGFSPDLVWAKSRSNAYEHVWNDTIRGAGYRLFSNTTGAESLNTNAISALNSNGFSLGSDLALNASSATHVAWCWDAGSTSSTNTSGSITSTVRANPQAGFSIVSYSVGSSGNYTVGHGLGVTPKLIIVKQRSPTTDNWQVWHTSFAANERIYLNLTNAKASNASWWNNTLPTSSVFSINVGTQFDTNQSVIAYCFAEIEGYSKFGSYTGNGSSDGPFVWCGFRPRWVMIKRTDVSTENWMIKDSVRSSINPTDNNLFPDLSLAEQTSTSDRYIDFISNGFKNRGTNIGINASSGTYVFAAFAESPFKYSRAR